MAVTVEHLTKVWWVVGSIHPDGSTESFFFSAKCSYSMTVGIHYPVFRMVYTKYPF